MPAETPGQHTPRQHSAARPSDTPSQAGDPERSLPLSRRAMIRTAGVAASALLVGCTSDGTPTAGVATASPAPEASPVITGAAATARPAPDRILIPPARFDALDTCQLTPAASAGPFPNSEELVRSDITEGRPGRPIYLGLRVVDADCMPVPGAEVAVWHTDHTGDYSGYTDGGSGKDEGEGTTFLRGVQVVDENGIVAFRTIFPGWYDGRAVHIHVQVRTPEGAELITQLYFDEAFTSEVLAEGVYGEFGPPDTSLAQDGLAGDPAADGTMLSVDTLDAEGIDITLALLNLGIG